MMKSISTKLTVLNLVSALLAVSVLYVLMDRQLTKVMNARFVNHGETLAAALAKSVEPSLVSRDLTSVQSSVDQVLAIPDVAWAYVLAPDGRVLAHTFVPRFPDVLNQNTRQQQKVWKITLARGGPEITVFNQPVLTGIVGSVYLGLSTADLSAAVLHLKWLTLVSILAVMGAALLCIAAVTARIMAPIQELTRAANLVGVEGGAAFHSLPVMADDEIGVLTRTFNRMVEEIRQDQETLEARVQMRTEELAAQTAHLNALIENNPLAIAVFDSEELLQMCNPAFERLFQLRQAEIRGANIRSTLATGNLSAESEEMSHAALAGRGMHVTTQRSRKDGSRVEVEIDSVPLVVEGKHIGSFRLYQDISERKKYQEELLRAKEVAESGTRAKSEFLANMSHEIRTPMNGIIGMTDLALDTDLSQEQREYLVMVKSSADSLLMLINDILDFSKIEAGKLDLSPIPFGLRDSLDDTVKSIAQRASQKGLELTCDIPATLPEGLVGDPDRLKQIVVNLLSNAVKFTEKGEVGVKVQEESRAEDHIILHFSISDTGVGIPLNKQEVIFQAFSQADNTTTRHYGGTGLGLTISSRLVEMMKGRIWVKSEPGVGSVFHFTAMFGLADDTIQRVCPKLPADLEGLPVLVVDDNATNRRILSEVLEGWRMVPDLVDSGTAAIKAMATAGKTGGSYALILLDCQMPGMSGFDLAAHLRDNPTLNSAPIIMLTSAGIRGDAERCRLLGIPAYLSKPIKQSELMTAVLKVLAGPVHRDEPAGLLVAERPTAKRLRTPRILLAEDNVVNARLAGRLLEKQGHAYRLVANGKEAVAAFLDEPFDLILMDVQMPQMDGLAASRIIRESERKTGGHVPIIALTAHAMKGDHERCTEAGMDGYLSKPINAAELTTAIATVLRKPNTLGEVAT